MDYMTSTWYFILHFNYMINKTSLEIIDDQKTYR